MDKSVHLEINRWVAPGDADLDAGLRFYSTGGGRSSPYLELLKITSCETPDRGRVRAPVLALACQPQSQSESSFPRTAAPRKEARTQRSRSPHRSDPTCRVCRKPLSTHQDKRFCKAERTGNKKGDRKGDRKSKNIKPGDSASQKVLPDFLSNCAARTMPTDSHPSGVPVCWDYHNPNKGCRGENCKKSHLCPKFMPQGGLCGKSHRAVDHF